jgi:LAO/AO transport system kinase
MRLVRAGQRIAVLAVDPSSRLSGGSILGDKTRMPGLATQPAAYIRPSPSAGTLGGVARKTRESMLVCEAAGYDVLLIETVGVGQSETMVADMTDCFIALMLPGAGDELQAVKRGLLELVDVIAVNKADGATKQAAEVAARQYSTALQSLAGRDGKSPAVLTCSSLNHDGVNEIWDLVERRQTELKTNGELLARRQRQNLNWLWSTVEGRLQQAVRNDPKVAAIRIALEHGVLNGSIPPDAAARQILEAFGVEG